MARKKNPLFSRQSKSEQVTVSFKVPKSVKERETDINERLALIDKELRFSLADVAKQAAMEAIEDAEKELEKMAPASDVSNHQPRESITSQVAQNYQPQTEDEPL